MLYSIFYSSNSLQYLPIPVSILLLDSDKAAAITGDVSLQTASGDIGGAWVYIHCGRDPVRLDTHENIM